MENKASLISKISGIILAVACVIALAVTLVWSIGIRNTVTGHSMSNTLNSGDVVLLNKAAYKLKAPNRFDVICFLTQSGEESFKRIIGLPGESVQIKNGTVYIDGAALTLPDCMGTYTAPGLAADVITIKEGEYFVLGDNGDASEDSRYEAVGMVRIEDVLGKVWLRISPFDAFGRIK